MGMILFAILVATFVDWSFVTGGVIVKAVELNKVNDYGGTDVFWATLLTD